MLSGRQKSIRSGLRFAEYSGATEWGSARLGEGRERILGKAIGGMSYKRQAGFSQAITSRWRETF